MKISITTMLLLIAPTVLFTVLSLTITDETSTSSRSRSRRSNFSSLANVTNEIKSVNWTAFGDGQSGWFEGFLKVPVDHYNLDIAPNTSFQIYCFRHGPTANSSEGLLYFNFGGPGVEADSIIVLYPSLPLELQINYDIIACDPRGIGTRNKPNLREACTDPITLDSTFDFETFEVYQNSIQKKTIAGLKKCADSNALLMQHMGTRQVVADVDLLRETMGFDKISFVGYSYGTRIGGVYATQFPERIDKLVLDSNMPPELERK
eukprot:Awhi_evm2s14867